MAEIIVLLSSYNGEKYIKEQINSILLQKDVELVLLVRDDGSKDATCEILKLYADAEKIVWMNEGENRNLGFRDSFLLLLREAYKRFPEAKYFSFADQDDVWLEDKLRRALDMISDCGNEKGVLYYSNKTCVDEKLNKIKDEDIQFYNDYLEVIWNSLASGCTMVFDRTLAYFVLKNKPSIARYHDSWVYRLAKSIGSDIVFDHEARILYRQHGNNTAGEEAMDICPKRSLWYILTESTRNYFIREKDLIIRDSLHEIREYYEDDLTEEAKEWIYLMETYEKKLRSKWSLLTKSEIRKRGGQMRLRWTAKIIFNMF